jgi:ribonuclease T2
MIAKRVVKKCIISWKVFLMRMHAAVLGMALAVLSFASPVRADVALSGVLTVTHACAAYQSIRKGTNPGAVTVEPTKTYDVLAGNKANPTHYRVTVPGAQPAERWVSAACGEILATGQASATAAGGAKASGARATHVLAMGWEPAFCATHRDKSECRALKSTSFAATHLSLHGLWPQPRGTQYCNVAPNLKDADKNHNWDALPEPAMSAETQKRLAAVMPGFQSKLQRHEWIVHGTCFGGSADAYFARSAGLAEAIDASPVSKLFADNAGKNLSATVIRAAFDDAFGPGSGARVAVSCGRGGNRKITELVINLAGDVTGTASLGDLMRAAPTVPPGCPGGLVERAPS